MDVKQANLGIFELVAYVFSGFACLALLYVPVAFVDPIAASWISRIWGSGVGSALVLLPVGYLVGILLSTFSMRYYNGWKVGKLTFIETPYHHPHRQGPIPVWKKVRVALQLSDDSTELSDLSEESLFHCATHLTVLSPHVSRIAANTRFCAAAVLTCSVTFLMSLVVICVSQGALNNGDSSWFLPVYAIANALASCFAHRVARSSADSYWVYVAWSIILADRVKV